MNNGFTFLPTGTLPCQLSSPCRQLQMIHADTSCCLTFPSPGNDGVVCPLTPDLQEAVKLLSACHRDSVHPRLFLKAYFPIFQRARELWKISGISMHIQSFIRGRWTYKLRSAAGRCISQISHSVLMEACVCLCSLKYVMNFLSVTCEWRWG